MRRTRGVLAAFAALWTILLSATPAHADDGWVIEGIDMTAANSGWYAGNAPFQAAFLASSLESMNANISSAITYVPPGAGSSSGFGGGGFSGGGGGGGGGGSW